MLTSTAQDSHVGYLINLTLKVFLLQSLRLSAHTVALLKDVSQKSFLIYSTLPQRSSCPHAPLTLPLISPWSLCPGVLGFPSPAFLNPIFLWGGVLYQSSTCPRGSQACAGLGSYPPTITFLFKYICNIL